MVYGVAAWFPTYLMRTFTLDIRVVGSIMAFMQFPICAGGLVLAGYIVDREFSKGKNDAHMHHFARTGIVIAVIGCLGLSFSTTILAVTICFAFIQLIQPFSGVAGAALQIAVPSKFRGRISAAFIMCYNAAGMTLGPSFVILIKDHFTKNYGLGLALALSYAILGSAAALCLWLGRKPAAAAINFHKQQQKHTE